VDFGRAGPGSVPSSLPGLRLRLGPGVSLEPREWLGMGRMAGTSWGILTRLAGRSCPGAYL